MARGTYIVSGANLTLSGAPTLVFINPGTTASLEILRVAISQAANATSNQQRVQFHTQVTAFPTLTSATPAKTVLLDAASVITGGTAGAAGTAGINASAEGAGAKTVLYQDAFNVLNGFLWVPTPAETFIMSAGSASGFGVMFPAAPVTATGWNISLVYREV